jgi:hypothetical protein
MDANAGPQKSLAVVDASFRTPAASIEVPSNLFSIRMTLLDFKLR